MPPPDRELPNGARKGIHPYGTREFLDDHVPEEEKPKDSGDQPRRLLGPLLLRLSHHPSPGEDRYENTPNVWPLRGKGFATYASSVPAIGQWGAHEPRLKIERCCRCTSSGSSSVMGPASTSFPTRVPIDRPGHPSLLAAMADRPSS